MRCRSHKMLRFGQPCAAAHSRQIRCGDMHPGMRPQFATADVIITISAQLSAFGFGHKVNSTLLLQDSSPIKATKHP